MRGSNYRLLTGENLVFWIGGRLREVVGHGGWTVYIFIFRNERKCDGIF